MSEVSRLLDAVAAGDRHAASDLLPVVYDELRRLAAQQLASEKPGQTLQATALVHEAYVRLVGGQGFTSRRHFFGAAAEAMRRVLVDRARARQALKRGGEARRCDVEWDCLESRFADNELIETHDLFDRLALVDSDAAELVRLHVFGGCSLEEAGDILGISRATAYRNWSFARAWLRDALMAS